MTCAARSSGRDLLQRAAVAAERRAQPVDDDRRALGDRGSSPPMLPRVAAGRTIGPTEHPHGGRAWTCYPWLKTLHILFAIVAVGFNISYGIWQARAAREPEHMGYALRGIKFMDDRVANPAYGGLLVVGIILVLIGPYDFTTSGLPSRSASTW